LDFFDYAWTTTFQITKKGPENLKILLKDSINYPKIRVDKHGYVLYFAVPRKTGKNLVFFQGMRLNLENDFERRILWLMYKASIYHLSAHAAISNFKAYKNWVKKKDFSKAMFTISIIEDAIANAYLKAYWNFLLPELAVANSVSYLRLKPFSRIPKRALRFRTAIISQYTVGKIKGMKIPEEMRLDVEKIVSQLKNLEKTTLEKFLQTEKNEDLKNIIEGLTEPKLKTAESIYAVLSNYGESSQIPAYPYMDNHGNNTLFYKKIGNENSTMRIAKQAFAVISDQNEESDGKHEELEKILNEDVSQVFYTWKSFEERKNKILEKYKILGKNTNFNSFVFPEEDYAEYLRRRALLGSSIRRILEKLRLLKNVTGEDFRQEAGLVDLQEAIQVIASKSQRTDIFVREELQTREDRWTILVDASRSLKFFTNQVRDIALCLAEVAKNVILNQNAWGMFAFNNNFYIIKDFDEMFTNRIKARIGGLTHGGMSYIPDAIKIAVEGLKGHIEESKVIVVVSDFFPAGYENVETELKQIVKHVERLGIGIIGIGVNSRAVRNYFRFNCIVRNPYELMKKFTKAFIEFSST